MGKFADLIKGDQPVLVDFFADWCQPCKTMDPIIKQVAKDNKGEIKVIKINIDKNRYAAEKYQIRSIPTMILFKNGKVAWRATGVKSKKEINSAVANHL